VLVPTFSIANANTNVNIYCTNHQYNDQPLEVSFTKNISSDEIALSTHVINSTTIRIQFIIKNYVGIIGLLCYSRDKRSEGTKADIAIRGGFKRHQHVIDAFTFDALNRDHIQV
jgi:hypothetical protein